MVELRKEIPELTGIRGIAATMVLLFHMRELSPQVISSLGVVDRLAQFGYLGVDIFFILSGFILCHVYGRTFSSTLTGVGIGRFMWARAVRLYPLHLMTLFLMLGVYWIGRHKFGVTPVNDSYYSLRSTLASAALVSEWFRTGAPNPSSWSISVELASYLLFPFVLAASVKFKRVIFVLAAPVLLICAAYASTRLGRGVAEFYIGLTAYRILTSFEKVIYPNWLALVALVAPFIWFGISGYESVFFLVPCFTVAVVGLGLGHNSLSRLLSTMPILYIGEISYSLYMTQWFVLSVWKHAGPKFVPSLTDYPVTMMLLATFSTLVFSALTYRLIELPARQWGRRNVKPATVALNRPV